MLKRSNFENDIIHTMRRLAYIPARGGSKGIPRKNITLLGDKPMIAYTIEAALKSNLFSHVMVSTDSEEIAEVARKYGAWIPFLRDEAFAQDKTTTIETVMSDKVRLEAQGESFDTFVLLQCTSPFRRAVDIAGAVALAEQRNAGVVSVSPVSDHPLLIRTVDGEGRMTKLLSCSSTCRRQDMPTYYRVNGAIYVNMWSELTPTLSFNDNPYGYVMAQQDAQDIDSLADLFRARESIKMRSHEDAKL